MTSQVQFSSVAQSCPTLRPRESQHARPPCPSPTPGVHSDSTSIESVMPSSHLILCRPRLLLPPIPPSIRVFSNESTPRMRWPKCWSFSFSIIPSNEIPRLVSFRMDWLDLLADKGTLKSLLQHHSSKASIRGRGVKKKKSKKSINSLALSFLHSPTLTSIHDYWKNHSLD